MERLQSFGLRRMIGVGGDWKDQKFSSLGDYYRVQVAHGNRVWIGAATDGRCALGHCITLFQFLKRVTEYRMG